jgi:DNA-binding CsgD family transcriptional regulator
MAMSRISSPGKRASAAQGPLQAAGPPDNNAKSQIRKLIRQVKSQDNRIPSDRTGGDEGAVILDVEVDGVRCLLIRAPRREWAHPVLSPREQEIARMVAKGYPNKTIARVLDISAWTVGTHLRRIFAKLSVGSRAAMVARLHEEDFTWSRDDR